MTDAQKHAAHLRRLMEHCTREDEAALLVGAEALEILAWLHGDDDDMYSNVSGLWVEWNGNGTFRAFLESEFKASKNANHQRG